VILQGAVPRGNATRENISKLNLQKGDVIYRCPKCVCVKPDRAHHCRFVINFEVFLATFFCNCSWWLGVS